MPSPDHSGRLRNRWKVFVCAVIGMMMAVVLVGTVRQHPAMSFAPTIWTLLLSATALAGCVLGISSELQGRVRPAAWKSKIPVNPWKLVVCGYLLITGVRGLLDPGRGPFLPGNPYELAGHILASVAACVLGLWGVVSEVRKLRGS